MSTRSRVFLLRQWTIVAVVLVSAGGLAWGVGAALGTSTSPSPGGGRVTVRIGWTARPDNLNPFVGFEGASYEIWRLNYNLLFGFAAEDGSPTAELATEIPTRESGGISADGKVWTVKLRHGVAWQDGQPFTARDVAWTYNFIVSHPDSALAALSPPITKVEVVDDYTVRIICSKPKADMLASSPYILPEHIWAKMPAKVAEKTSVNKPPIVGTGPFETVSTGRGLGTIVMKANPRYWGGRPKIDEIVIETYQNADSMTDDLRSGALDVAWGIPAASFRQLASVPGIKPVAFTKEIWHFLGMNCYDSPNSRGNPVLRDVKFRQAISWAVDRKQIADVAYLGLATPGTTIIPPGLWPANWDAHYQPTPDETFGFDLERAKQLLDAAGYRAGPGGVRLDKLGKPISLRLLALNDQPEFLTVARLLAGWFGDIGLRIKIQSVDNAVYYAKIYEYTGNTFTPDFDMYLWYWFGYPDPGDSLSYFTTAQIGGWNDPAFSNNEFDKLNSEQLSELDRQKRLDMLHRMQQIFYGEAPEIVTVYPQDLEAYNTARWTGWVPYRSASPNGGSVFFNGENIDSFIFLHPRVAATSSSRTNWWVVGAVIAVVAVGIVVWLVVRRRPKAAEE